MSKKCISRKFIRRINILFGKATAMIYLNGSPSNNFRVETGVRQGCPLVPYIFFIVGEALTHLITKAVSKGRLKEITLPGG